MIAKTRSAYTNRDGETVLGGIAHYGKEKQMSDWLPVGIIAFVAFVVGVLVGVTR